MSSSIPFRPESLHDEAAWVRAIARSLVRDPDREDDLVQETWLAALRAGHRSPRDSARSVRSVRAWLATVMRNVVRQSARTERRRAEREGVVTRERAGECGRDPVDVLERASLHRLLVEAVTDLEEPFRTTLLLRYFDDLTPPQIASRLNVPLNTVRSRLRRGLERLRRSMDDRHDGERDAWLAALVPFLDPPSPIVVPDLSPNIESAASQVSPAAPIAAGGGIGAAVMTAIAMHTKGTLVVIAGALVAGIIMLPRVFETGRAGASAPTARPTLSAPTDVVANTAPSSPTATRELVESKGTVVPAAVGSDAIASTTKTFTMHGRVLGVDTRPMPAVSIRWHPDEGERIAFESDSDGAFELDVENLSGAVRSDQDGTITILEGRPGYGASGQTAEPIVVVARSITAAGAVHDEAGKALANALITYQIPKSFGPSFPQVLEGSHVLRFSHVTDANGRFEIENLPVIDGAQLLTRKAGRVDDRRTAPADDDFGIDIVLRVNAAEDGSLFGRVIDPSGEPVAGAHVAAGPYSRITDEHGEFLFDPDVASTVDEIIAVAPGYVAVRAWSAQAEPDESARNEWPDFVWLTLEDESLALEGIVVDDLGEPLAGVRIWVDDPTPFGLIEGNPVPIENLLSERLSTDELMELGAQLDQVPNSFWSWSKTDADGKFHIEGLLDRTYRIGILHRATMTIVRIDGVEAGSRSERFELPIHNDTTPITGRLVDAEGDPVPNASVTVQVQTYAQGHTTWSMNGPEARSDDRGVFTIAAVPRTANLLVSAEGYVSLHRELTPDDDTDTLELTLQRERGRAHLQIVLDDPAFADYAALYDANGDRVHLTLIRGGARSSFLRAHLTEGRSYVLLVDAGQYELVYYRDDEEVERRLETFTPGDHVVLTH